MLVNKFDDDYLDLLRDILTNGNDRGDRTGTGTRGVFGRQLRFDLTQGFPLLTSKRVHRKSIIHELLWFLSGSTNIAYLKEHGISIWDAWADENGELGPVYGKQWRSWAAPDGRVIDQITNLINSLRDNPNSRRHIVSAWNPAEVDDMALPPCHCLFQFYVRELTVEQREAVAETEECLTFGGAIFPEGTPREITDPVRHAELDRRWRGAKVPRYYLDCQLYQRSADVFLGVPFNIASYALLIHMIAHQLNMIPGEFVHTFGDVHLYRNHFDQAREQLSRWDRTPPAPTLTITRKPDSLFGYAYEDFRFDGYNPLSAISAPIAV